MAFQPQNIFTGLCAEHFLPKLQILVRLKKPMLAFFSFLPFLLDFFLQAHAYIGVVFLYKFLSVLVELLHVVGSMVYLVRLDSEPLVIVKVYLVEFLLGQFRVRVLETQNEDSVMPFCELIIYCDCLCVTYMGILARLRRKCSHDFLIFPYFNEVKDVFL